MLFNASCKHGRHHFSAFLEFVVVYTFTDFGLGWNILTWLVSFEVIHDAIFFFWPFVNLKFVLQTRPSYAPSSGAMQMRV